MDEKFILIIIIICAILTLPYTINVITDDNTDHSPGVYIQYSIQIRPGNSSVNAIIPAWYTGNESRVVENYSNKLKIVTKMNYSMEWTKFGYGYRLYNVSKGYLRFNHTFTKMPIHMLRQINLSMLNRTINSTRYIHNFYSFNNLSDNGSFRISISVVPNYYYRGKLFQKVIKLSTIFLSLNPGWHTHSFDLTTLHE